MKRLSQICEILGTSEGEILNGTCSDSPVYLSNEFAKLLLNCSSTKQRLIYDVAKVIAESKEQ